MKGFGETDFNKRLIRVNKKRCKDEGSCGEVIDTIVHEELHAKHPSMSEKGVVKKAAKLTAKMSTKRKRRLYSKYRSK